MTADNMRARSFETWAGEYDRYRPGYPDAVFDTIEARVVLPRQPLVVDLGAGTGRASLPMAERGWRVTAVEPAKGMLDLLRDHASDMGLIVSTVQADAEETGLDPASADLVTAGQAFHWFDLDRALSEISRILKPGGGVALFWNVRDRDRSPLLADYAALLERYVPDGGDMGRYEQTGREAQQRAFAQSTAFTSLELVNLEHQVPMTPEEFLGMVFTASYVRTGLSPEQQAQFRSEVEGLLQDHGHVAQQPFAVPYRIDLWLARRTS